MQNRALQACDLDFIYVPFEVTPENLHNALLGLKSLGVSGFNVTIPHKSTIIPYLDDLDESAILAGAVNTVKNDSGRFIGYNTDGDGLLKSLSTDLDFDPENSSIIIVGAGGAARGAIAALCRGGAKRILIANRSYARALELALFMSGQVSDTEISVITNENSESTNLLHVNLLINTTSLGMNNERIDFPQLTELTDRVMVYDMVYSPSTTPLLLDAATMGLKAANGLGMLAAQGELAFTIWTGETPPSGLMKSTLTDVYSC
jgi:shikimate dehydrogenase